MLEILYGEKGSVRRASKEIDAGRPVAIKIVGWKKHLIRRTLSLYAEYDCLSRKGEMRRGLYLNLAWRILLTPSIMGLCMHAQSAGMAVAAYEDEEQTLEIRFESPLHVKGS